MGPDRARMDFEMDSAEFTPERSARRIEALYEGALGDGARRR